MLHWGNNFVTIQSPREFNNIESKRVKEKIVNLSIYNSPQMCYTKEKTGGEKYSSYKETFRRRAAALQGKLTQ